MSSAVIAYGAPILALAMALGFAAFVMRANRHPPGSTKLPPGE